MAGKKRRFGRVRQLPSGRWQARYRGPDGLDRPAPHTFPTKTDADVWLTQVEADIRRREWHDPDAGCIPLEEFGDLWISERPNLAPRTRALYEGLWRLHVKPDLGDFDLVDITPARVRTWRQGLVDAGVGEVTAAKAYRLLKTVLNTAVDDELIRRNPCRIKGAGQERSAERPVVTVPQVFEIADCIRPWFRALVLLAAFASLRWGELVALRRRHLDLEDGLVHVRSALVELDGELVEGSPKSLAGSRDVAIPAVIVPDLRVHLNKWAQRGPDGLVFVGPKGATPRRSNFQAVWREAIEGAGLDGVHFHDLRHAGNVLASRAGSLKEVMAHMGHASSRAALIYQHATLDGERAIGEAVSRMIEAERRKANGHVTGTKGAKGRSGP